MTDSKSTRIRLSIIKHKLLIKYDISFNLNTQQCITILSAYYIINKVMSEDQKPFITY